MSKKQKPTGYRLALSGDQTWLWANNPGKVWPNSFLAGKSLYIEVDSLNGLYCCQIDEDDSINVPDTGEIEAIVADHMPANCRHLWPAWGQPD